MKSLSVSASLATLLFTVLAFAQEGTQDFELQKLSSRTRADVRAELDQARASGGIEPRGEGYGSFRRTEIASTHERAVVRAEFEAARRARALDTRNYAGSYGGFLPGEIKSTKTREEVQAELAKARAAAVRPSQGERSDL